MILPSFTDIQKYAGEYPYVPLAVRLAWPDRLDPWELLKALQPSLEGAALLESGRAGRFTYLAWQPVAVMQSKDLQTTVAFADGQTERIAGKTPLFALRELLARYRTPVVPGLPDFCGGAVGYLSYDMNRFF